MALATLFTATLVVSIIFLLALLGWGGQLTRLQRIGLLCIAAGIVAAGPGRYLKMPLGFGDLLFMAGLLLYLLASYAPALRASLDAADGARDGRIDIGAAAANVTTLKPRRRATGALIAIAAALAFVGVGRSTAEAAKFEPFLLRVALQGPGRLGVVEVGQFETRDGCVAARDVFLRQAKASKGEFTTPDGLRWTVLGARCSVPGTPA